MVINYNCHSVTENVIVNCNSCMTIGECNSDRFDCDESARLHADFLLVSTQVAVAYPSGRCWMRRLGVHLIDQGMCSSQTDGAQLPLHNYTNVPGPSS